jgi:hypothetical protein
MTKLPSFLCIGAQRAGTTWLHNCLTEHPELFLPQKKEVHFFDRQYDKGLEWYAQHFKEANNEMIGEITPNYYHAPNALQRIKDDLPDAKLIYVLREPVSRTYSQYQLYKQGAFKGKTFKQVIAEEESVIEFSLQGKHLETLLSLFSKNNILILFYDDISNTPQVVLEKVFQFLNVDSTFKPSFLNKRVNRIVLPRTQNMLKKVKLDWLIELVKESPFAESIKTYLHKAPKSEITPEIKVDLRSTFLDDIKLIEKQLDVQLDSWKK